MNKFYTSAYPIGDNILVRGYENGVRFARRVKYKPTFFVPSRKPNAEWRSIFGAALDRIDFDSMRDAKDFISKYEDVANFDIYGLPRFEYVFLNQEYPGEIVYDNDIIRRVTIDIEVGSENGFPNVDTATEPVTAITMKKDDEYIVLGCDAYMPKERDVRYVRCNDEEELLRVFLDEWERGTQPDIVTGWNITFFDIPYLVHRIANVLGADQTKRLSPWGLIKERKTTIMGKEQTAINIVGVAVLDYLEMYRKFTYSQQESYKLDHIAHVELGDSKLDYSEYETLHSLYKNDYTKFIDYNIKDVRIVDKLEDKMKLIEMAIALAYDAKVNLNDVFTQVRMWDVIIHNHLWNKKIAVPISGGGHKDEAYVGAYVKTPRVGFHKWVVSFDLNSLYPHLIMQYNISPEKLLVGKKINIDIEDLLGDDNLPIIDGYSLASNGCYFKNDSQGFLPEIMQRMYNDRVVYKEKMIAAQKRYEQATSAEEKKQAAKDISRYKNMQLAKKVQLNSAYGAIGNPHFRFFNLDQATAITMGGQLSIRWAENKLNEYMNKMLKTEGYDYVIASDTDSLYVDFSKLVSKVFPNEDSVEREKIVSFLDRATKEGFEPVIDKIYSNLSARVNAFEQKMSMKREVIADRGIWTAKKRYILNVHDSEGVRYAKPKLKMMGIETVKSSTPSSCRKALTEALSIIMNSDEKHLQDFIAEFRQKFTQLPFEEIAFPRGLQNLNKYMSNDAKAIPIHARAAMGYNRYLRERKLHKKYESIKSGEKIKFCYMKVPNPIRENVVAIISTLPKELGLHEYIDYNVQFDKAFLEPLRSILNVIHWEEEKRNTIEDFFT